MHLLEGLILKKRAPLYIITGGAFFSGLTHYRRTRYKDFFVKISSGKKRPINREKQA